MVTIALIEDDQGHARLIEKNMQRLNIANDIILIKDGQEAIDFIFRKGTFAVSPRPSPLLILLDLNLPVYSGYDILKRLKEDNDTKRIPIIILTTTEDSAEIHKCYDLGCNVFITKPVEYEQFCDAIKKIGLFLSIVSIPNGT